MVYISMQRVTRFQLSCMLICMKKKNMSQPFILILYGPTGVGKTDIALSIAARIPAEIINMDVGQFYTPLSIGTAKPDWKQSAIPHHLFDIINTPIHYTVAEYRALFHKKVHEIVARGNLPIVVGGSGFYLHALLFPPNQTVPDIDIAPLYSENDDLWQKLYTIDPQRAINIDKADMYRIKRALSIWHATGALPSSYAPCYSPDVDYLLLFLERDRLELHKRIDNRVIEMFNAGWIAETTQLMGTAWQEFIKKKNIIGYNEIFNYLAQEKNNVAYNAMIERIQIKTKQYAKRQFTFWRKLEREIKEKSGYTNMQHGYLESLNLTNLDITMYSNQLLKRLSLLLGKKHE